MSQAEEERLAHGDSNSSKWWCGVRGMARLGVYKPLSEIKSVAARYLGGVETARVRSSSNLKFLFKAHLKSLPYIGRPCGETASYATFSPQSVHYLKEQFLCHSDSTLLGCHFRHLPASTA